MNPKLSTLSLFAFMFFSTIASSRTQVESVVRQSETCVLLLSKNISPEGARPGTVIASPSRKHPDYYYHWVRDAGLVMSTWLDVRNSGVSEAAKARIDLNLEQYWQITLHHQTMSTAADLGEVKFHVEGEVFSGEWGRPQNDGPAIRALSLMKWQKLLVAEKSPLAFDPALYSADLKVHSAIKRDLEYLSHRWRDTDFDVWEEVKGHHFFTRLFQMHALRNGAELAKEMDDPAAAHWYTQNARELQLSLERHWDANGGFIKATLDRDRGLDYKSGLDSAVLIAVLETDQYANIHQSTDWTVLDPRVQSTVRNLEAVFTKIYGVNAHMDSTKGPMIGRYPEDTYDGVRTGKIGNPWFLNTHYTAEFYYKLAAALEAKGVLQIDDISRPFWSKYVDADQGTVTKGKYPEWNQLVAGLVQHGDAIMHHARSYVGAFGTMDEQVQRDTGAQAGARDLSWSYSSFLRASSARAKVASFLQRN